MKRISIFMLFVLLTISVSAKYKVHTLIYADTNDDKIGKSLQIDVMSYGSFVDQIITAVGWINSPAPIVRTGYNCSKTQMMQDLDNLQIDNEDIVIFIYNGHGTRAVDDWSDFPQMCFAKRMGYKSRLDADSYPLENVKKIIMKKNPRFCLVIGDCCNSVSGVSVKPESDVVSKTEKDIRRATGEKSLRKLFLGKYGSVMITASKKGEFGWSNESIGSFLQYNLYQVISDMTNKGNAYDSWTDLLQDAATRTYNFSVGRKCTHEGKIYTQTPYYKVDLSNTPPTNTIITDSTTPPPITETDVRTAMLIVADNRHLSDEERIRKYPDVLQKYFSSEDALIDVVGKDNQTIIYTTNAKKYLRRISTEINLTNIKIIEEQYAKNGKTMYLKLHEVYSEKNK